MTSRVGVAIHPGAGAGRGVAAGARCLQALAAAGLHGTPITGTSAAALSERVAEALAAGLDALVVVGGDGMVHLGVNLLAQTPVPLGIVAAGTGNDVARSLGLPVGDPDAATRVVVQALRGQYTRTVDAVRCHGDVGADGDSGGGGGDVVRWFVGVLGAGFDAIVNERANGWRWPRGRRRYDAAILRELPVFRPREYHLDLDGERRVLRAMLVAVANGPAYGGGLLVCPNAQFDDGLLDVLVVAPLTRLQFVRLLPRVSSGTHLRHEAVQVVRAKRVTIASPGIVAYADGERLAPLPLVCEVVPGALRVLCPPPVPSVGPQVGAREGPAPE